MATENLAQPVVVKVSILSNNRLFRESLARTFAKKADLGVVDAAPIAPDTVRAALNSGSEILVLDSVGLLRENREALQSRAPGRCAPKVLLVAMDEEEELFIEAVRNGASGFIGKEASAMELVSAVRSVAMGNAVCPPNLCKYLFKLVQQRAAVPRYAMAVHLGLTRREQQLMPLIDRGLTNKEIASHFNLSEKTVKNHIHRLLRKAGAGNRMTLSAVCRQRTGLETSIDFPL